MHPSEVAKKFDTKLVYLPAATKGIEGAWDPSFYAHYPALLQSVVYGSLQPSVRKNCFVFGDSGGFSLLTGTITTDKLSAEYVIETANSFADVCATLDFPPAEGKVSTFGFERIMMRGGALPSYAQRLEWSAKNCGIMREKKREDLELYTVCHGENMEGMHEWYKQSDPDRETSGICLSPKPASSIRVMSLVLRFMIEVEPKYVHVFGVASLKGTLMLEFGVRKHKNLKLMSYDSTEFADGAKLKVVYSPHNLFRNRNGSAMRMFMRRFCDCPACLNWDWSKTPDAAHWDLHNLHMISRRNQFVAGLSDMYLEEALISKLGEDGFEYFCSNLEDGFKEKNLKTLEKWVE